MHYNMVSFLVVLTSTFNIRGEPICKAQGRGQESDKINVELRITPLKLTDGVTNEPS